MKTFKEHRTLNEGRAAPPPELVKFWRAQGEIYVNNSGRDADYFHGYGAALRACANQIEDYLRAEK